MAMEDFHLYWVLFGNRTILMPNKTKQFYNFSSPAKFIAMKYFLLYWVLFGNRTILMLNKTKQFYNFCSPAQLMAIKFSTLFGSVWHQNGSVA
jgi:hypothetical protein